MIPEKEREALMRLTMCAREECIMCKYHKECDFDYQYETATRCMNILAEALRKDDPSDSEKPNNCEELNAYRECVKSRSFWDSKHCDGCYFDERCPFDEPKDEPQRDCFLCKWLGEVNVCGRCRNRNLFAKADTEPKPKDEPTISKMEQVDKDINVRGKDERQTYVINPQEPTNDEKCFECDDFFTCGGQCNKIEDEPQTDCAWK